MMRRTSGTPAGVAVSWRLASSSRRRSRWKRCVVAPFPRLILKAVCPCSSPSQINKLPRETVESDLDFAGFIIFHCPLKEDAVDTLKMLAGAEFLYDSSSSAATPVTDPNTDAFWPYTLDYGMANDCLAVDGLCKGEPKLPGFWEVPMYAFFDNRGVAGVHLMDPWL